jgi:hypothetical protein
VFIVLHNQSVSICINQQHDITVLLNTGIKIKTTLASIQAQRRAYKTATSAKINAESELKPCG